MDSSIPFLVGQFIMSWEEKDKCVDFMYSVQIIMVIEPEH
jgi:hypothetical protein